MNIVFLLLISSYSIACGEEFSLKSVPMYSHFKTYIGTLLTKASLREKYCGEKLDSPACFQKLRKLPIADLIKIQNGIHEKDIDEFLVKEFSTSEARQGFAPLIVLQSDRIEHFLNMVAVECQQLFPQEKPIPVFDFFKSPFESIAVFLGTPDKGAKFFSACLENLKEGHELQRTVSVTAWKYSEVTNQIGQRSYVSSGEKLMNSIILQTPQFVKNYGACQNQ